LCGARGGGFGGHASGIVSGQGVDQLAVGRIENRQGAHAVLDIKKLKL
jgi:hypothetical protein